MDSRVTRSCARALLFVFFLALAAIYLAWTASDELADFGGDNAYYLLIARHFSPYSPPSLAAEFFFKNSLYPPMFPLLLALTGGGESTLAAHLVTTGCLIGVFLALYWWAVSVGIGRGIAVFATLLFALLPGTYMQALSVHSENLYVMFCLGAMLAVTRAETTKEIRWLYYAAVFTALASVTRSAGLSLVLAFVVYLVIWRPKAWGRLAVLATVPMTLWKLFGGEQQVGYASAFAEKFAGMGFIDAVERYARNQIEVFWYGWYSNFSDSAIGAIVMAVIGLVWLSGLLSRLRRGRFDGLYAAMYLGLILTWPFPAEMSRLIFVIVPVALVQILMFLQRLPPLPVARIGSAWSVLALLAAFLIALPSLVLTATRFSEPLPDGLDRWRRNVDWYVIDRRKALAGVIFSNQLAQHLRSIKDQAPSEACLYGIKPSIIGYYADRKSLVPPREKLDDRAFHAALQEGGCRYFYLSGFVSPSYATPYYPLQRLGASLKVLSVAESPGSPGRPIGLLAVWTDQ